MNNSMNRDLPGNQHAEGTDCMEFSSYMSQMAEKYQIRKIEISRITGISADYLYKILYGKKRTAERDYIIAICRASGMNLQETDHALKLNGMAVLNMSDRRDCLIAGAIEENVSIRRLNDRLENEGFPWLRVSSDMEHYVSGE